jgi:membrane protease YdiL (CAAX protease family)
MVASAISLCWTDAYRGSEILGHRNTTSKGTPVRVKPSAAISIVLVVIYMAIVIAFWKAYDVKYDQVQDTVQSIKEGVAYPVAVGALFLVVAATVLGWWGPAIIEKDRLTSKLRVALPILLVLGAVANLVITDWDNVDSTFGLWLTISVLLVGFSEELLTRGLGLVGARGTFPEFRAMIFTAIIFGLIHAVNGFFGQDLKTTIQQVMFAAIFGIVYYVLRRATGSLVIPMLLHALWDGSLLVNDHSGKDPSPASNLLMIAAVVISVLMLRHQSKADAPQTATA